MQGYFLLLLLFLLSKCLLDCMLYYSCIEYYFLAISMALRVATGISVVTDVIAVASSGLFAGLNKG